MPSQHPSPRPYPRLFARLGQRLEMPAFEARSGDDREALQQAAQLALQVEFSTIPVYLTGLYSIQDPSSEAFQALRAVVMEEMFHVNVAANLVVALGALPRFTGDAAPKYPGHLPHANPNTTPLLGLYPASVDVFGKVYAAIENPAPADAPPQADQYDSIAQLYKALSDAIQAYPGDPFADPDPNGRQRTDIYLGKFGGDVQVIRCKKTAQHAIDQIVRQGEGAVPPYAPLVPVEPFGSYNHYGARTDGTYGPILGTPLELSHWARFQRIALSTDPFPPTAPIISNAHAATLTNPEARHLAHLFNHAYNAMLHGFERSFQQGGDPYFGQVLHLMHKVLPDLSRTLMKTPAYKGGDADVGPYAAPPWEAALDTNFDAAIAEALRLARSWTRSGLLPVVEALTSIHHNHAEAAR